MAKSLIILGALILVSGGFELSSAPKIFTNTYGFPKIIQSCYNNTTDNICHNRQSMKMTIENLIAIIEKLEQKTNNNWDMGEMARTIIKSYQFEGIEYQQPNLIEEFSYNQSPFEKIKSQIIQPMIPSYNKFPDSSLDNDEICTLHRMISHSVSQIRFPSSMAEGVEVSDFSLETKEPRVKRSEDDSDSDYYDDDVVDGRRNKRSVDTQIGKPNNIVETGVVLTQWGTIAVGRVISGIAAGLQPQEESVKSHGRFKFVNIKNLFATTLAGDIGQAAILNARHKLDNVDPPTGKWNSLGCPNEFILNYEVDDFNDYNTWTHMTAAEIRGGIDGLILGAKLRDSNCEITGGKILRLSELLKLYYMKNGINFDDKNYRACERFNIFNNMSQEFVELREQAKSFAFEFNRRAKKVPALYFHMPTFMGLVDSTYKKMLTYGGSLSSIDGQCQPEEETSSES